MYRLSIQETSHYAHVQIVHTGDISLCTCTNCPYRRHLIMYRLSIQETSHYVQIVHTGDISLCTDCPYRRHLIMHRLSIQETSHYVQIVHTGDISLCTDCPYRRHLIMYRLSIQETQRANHSEHVSTDDCQTGNIFVPDRWPVSDQNPGIIVVYTGIYM